jgi:hypothetical protein
MRPIKQRKNMPDITMCNDYSCPDFDRCYRAQAKPSMRQSYFCGSPRSKDECTYFSPLDTEEEAYANRPRHRNQHSTRQD